jgi:hypothetical protein
MDLREEFEDRLDDFEILAFHDNRIANWRALEPELEKLERGVWNGRKLPFPILLDSTGTTLETYGIRAFPTTVAIDPEGNVVKGSGEVMLENYLLETSEHVRELLGGLRARFSRTLPRAIRRKDTQAAYALARYGAEASEEEVRKIFKALEKIGSRHAVLFFIGPEGLENASRDRRLLAVAGLRELATPAGFQPLSRTATKDADPAVRKAAQRAVEALVALWDD